MAKDPAFLFYSQDFYTGVATMSWEDRGKYISLICLMHQQGRLTEETIRFLVGSVSDNLKSKFKIDDAGLWYNERLEEEAVKRSRFTESRRLNGNLGGRPKESEPIVKPNGKAKNNLSVTHKDNLMEDENENHITKALAIKKESFKKEVYQAGGLIYTGQMLDNFVGKWTETSRGKNPKMKFEKEKTFEVSLRLATWARNNFDKIVCFLTDDQRTIKQKQYDLVASMDKFREKYSSEIMNAFYAYWSMPENKKEPKFLRWELEEFWDLGQRLSSWNSSPLNKSKGEEKVAYTIPQQP